jgi:hypothetical protein
MNTYEKYIKYKSKYLKLKKILSGGGNTESEQKKILLMFLGGTPIDENIITHYINMNTPFLTKDNFYIVIHPIHLSIFQINDRFAKLFNKEQIYIVDESHHILTGWATKSLVNATLLMMQFANIKNNNIPFDKYILLSGSCAPLYRFDNIYDVLNEDNLSWLNTSTDNPELTEKDFYIENTRMLPFKGSQWMILDKQHIELFFPDNKYSNTYTNIQSSEQCPIKNTIVSSGKIEIRKQTDNQDDLINFFNMYSDCDPSDEGFFCNYIMLKLLQKYKLNKVSNPAHKYVDEIKQNIKHISLTPILQNLRKYNKDIINKLDIIDKENLKKIIYEYPVSIGEAIFVNKNIDGINIKFAGRCDLITSEETTISNINVNYFGLGIDENPEEPLLLNQSTYCEWFAFNVDPFNFLRNFNMKIGFNIKEFLNDKSFYDLDTGVKIYNKIKENYLNDTDCGSCECSDYFYIKKEFYKSVLNVASHPVEYSCWTFLNLLNAYLLILYFKCSLTPPLEIEDLQNKVNKYSLTYREVYESYKKNISKILSIELKKLDQDYSIENIKIILQLILEKVQTDKTVLDIKFGTPITTNILLSAIGQGSLFIRKCLNTSLIETYSDVLNKINYGPNLDSEFNSELIEALTRFKGPNNELTPWYHIRSWEERIKN